MSELENQISAAFRTAFENHPDRESNPGSALEDARETAQHAIPAGTYGRFDDETLTFTVQLCRVEIPSNLREAVAAFVVDDDAAFVQLDESYSEHSTIKSHTLTSVCLADFEWRCALKSHVPYSWRLDNPPKPILRKIAPAELKASRLFRSWYKRLLPGCILESREGCGWMSSSETDPRGKHRAKILSLVVAHHKMGYALTAEGICALKEAQRFNSARPNLPTAYYWP